MKDLQYSKYLSPEIQTSNEDYTLVFRITNDSIDYSNEIVNPDGIKFVQRPKILYGHDHSILPPAKSATSWRKDNAWYVKIQFDVLKDPFARFLYEKYKDGYMTDCSIGFFSNREKQTVDENGILVHNDITVFEVSLVTIGANPDAYVMLSIEECDTIIKSISISNTGKKDFEDIKNKKLNDMQNEQIEKIINDIEEIKASIKTINETQDEIVKEFNELKTIQKEIEIMDSEIVEIEETINETDNEIDEDTINALKKLNTQIISIKKIL